MTVPGPAVGALVGNDAARALHGISAGADLVVLGTARAGGGRSAGGSDTTSARASATTPGSSSAAASASHLTGTAPASADGVPTLAALTATSDRRPLVVVAADAGLEVPALLDLLDRPGVRSAVLVGVPDDRAGDGPGLVRIGADRRLVESVGTAWHTVSRPDRVLVGVLRVDAADREEAAERWARHVDLPDEALADPFSLAVLMLVRGGVPVAAVEADPYTWSRADWRATGAPGSAWQQRLRASSRGGDGFVSTFVVRPLSRRLTGVGLRLGWAPNAVTVSSLVLGLAAAALVLVGTRWSWACAAVLLLAALVVDCVDGELARFTRTFSPLGAWLDAVGDRVKEYATLAAVAVVAHRWGEDLWLWTCVAMALVSARHFEDYANVRRLGPLRRSRPVLRPLGDRHDLEPEGRSGLVPAASRRSRIAYWVKNVMHLPIAERYVLIALGLLTFSPRILVLALLVGAALALAWTQGGRAAALLLGRAPAGGDDEVDSRGWTRLDHQLDLTPFGRRLLRRPLLGHRLGWQGPTAVWLVESAAYVLTGALLLPFAERGLVFALLCAVAYHRYDMAYRFRDIGVPPTRWAAALGLGSDFRIVLVVLVGVLMPGLLGAVIVCLVGWLAVVWGTESYVAWTRWLRAASEPISGQGVTE